MALQIIEGTWEQIKAREQEFIGRELRVTIKPLPVISRKRAKAAMVMTEGQSLLGKYAFVSGGSEAFMKQKQAEIDREDRTR